MLTVVYLTKNNEKTFEKSLESIKSIANKIIVIDQISTDTTLKIAKKYSAEISIKTQENASELRNEVIEKIKDGWILFLEPYERLISGAVFLKNRQVPRKYRFNVIQSGIVTKEVKFWHSSLKTKFVNPIYESIDLAGSEHLEIYIESFGKNDINIDRIRNWQKQFPTNAEPFYYEAFYWLTHNEYKKFLSSAESFLFRKTNDITSAMMTYYVGLIELYINNNVKKSIECVLQCLNSHILMAEFWCLLGDCYYKTKHYQKAYKFYENAMVLGSSRSKADEWPIEISKYRSHPEKMMNSCREIVGNSVIYISK